MQNIAITSVQTYDNNDELEVSTQRGVLLIKNLRNMRKNLMRFWNSYYKI